MTHAPRTLTLALIFALALALAFASGAQAATQTEAAYIFNTLSFLLHGLLVMWMAAGFTMLEAGLVRARNSTFQCVKNISLYAIAGLTYWLVGYNLMYLDVDSVIGSLAIWEAEDPLIAENGTFLGRGAQGEAAYAAGSDWFFQMVFVATAASIVSGALAERVKLLPFLLFITVLTAIIYPIQGAWSWGGGWLSQMGFLDFAGSTIVHSVGGWAALTGALIVGPRYGKFAPDGTPRPLMGCNLPLATLGTFVLWFGWFGFNGGSQLAMGSAADVRDIATIYINTNLAAAAGVVAVLCFTALRSRKIDLTILLNGALGGLVAITAEPLAPSAGLAVFIGAVGGLLVALSVPLLNTFKIDDVVGAIPVHLVAGIWGTLAVVLSNPDASLSMQLLGILCVGIFVALVSSLVWGILYLLIGLRPTTEQEIEGLDLWECGLEAYPEFHTTRPE